MAVNIKDLVVQIEQCEMLEKHYASRARDLRAQLQSISNAQPDSWDRRLKRHKRSKSALRWAEWLQSNGPAMRKDISAAVGLLTGSTPPYVDSLGKPMADIPDDFYPQDMMLRLPIENDTGIGRPADLYFLWSQRYDVFPDLVLSPAAKSNAGISDLTIIEPDELVETDPETEPEEEPEDYPEEEPENGRAEDLGTWLLMHADLFAAAKFGAKFDKEEVQRLRDSCPDGYDANAAIALAAVGRIEELIKPAESETLLGVIRPFEGLPSEFPDPDGPTIWDDLPEPPPSAAQRRMAEDDWGA